MNFNNFIYIFSFFNGLRTRKVTEGKHFFLINYSGISWHLRERRYLLMTRKGPMEYVFNLKHYLVCFAVFVFGLFSSLSIFTSFIISVIKDDLVSSASATPIIVADFIDYRALETRKLETEISKLNQKSNITFDRNNFIKNLKYAYYRDGKLQNKDFYSFNPMDDLSLKSPTLFTKNFKNTIKPDISFYSASLQPSILIKNLDINTIKNSSFFNSDTYEGSSFKVESEENNLSNLISWFKFPDFKLIDQNKDIVVKDVINKKELEQFSSLMKENGENKGLVKPKEFSINPAQMPPEAEAYRILSGFDDEISQFNELLKTLSINIGEELSQKVEVVLEKRDIVSPDSPIFFKQLTDRVSLTKDLRLALNFIPLKAPMDYYYVSSKFGMRKDPKTKKKRFHRGIDLAGTWHEDVLAPADGIVIFAGGNGGYGKMIKIQHRYGIVTAYGHLQKVLVKKGQKVNIGTRIGKMGSTGRSTGQHLHYEIIVNKKYIDPGIFIKEGKKLLTRNILQATSR